MSDATQPSPPDSNQIELEFVQHVLTDASEGYCWEFAERDVDLGPVSSESAEVLQTSLSDEPFFETLERAWHEADATAKLETQILRSLGDRLPQALLQTLLASAQQVLHTSQSLGEQLVHCVQDLIPQLDEDDLQVIARPYAMAMRDQRTPQPLDTLRSSIRAAQWSELSPVEQARLSLGISHYILTQLPRPLPRT